MPCRAGTSGGRLPACPPSSLQASRLHQHLHRGRLAADGGPLWRPRCGRDRTGGCAGRRGRSSRRRAERARGDRRWRSGGGFARRIPGPASWSITGSTASSTGGMPTHTTTPPVFTISIAWRMVARRPGRLDHHICAGPTGRRVYGADGVVAGGVDRDPAQAPHEIRAGAGMTSLQTTGCAQKAVAACIASRPMGPAPMTAALCPGSDAAPAAGVHADGEGLDHGFVLQAHARGQPVDEVPRPGEVLGTPAAVGRCAHEDHFLLADVVATFLAAPADAAGDARLDGHCITRPVLRNGLGTATTVAEHPRPRMTASSTT